MSHARNVASHDPERMIPVSGKYSMHRTVSSWSPRLLTVPVDTSQVATFRSSPPNTAELAPKKAQSSIAASAIDLDSRLLFNVSYSEIDLSHDDTRIYGSVGE